tara:strand:+ start:572 stop:958 length:387 start_codon:yes stop_codon:yes gene_type:complete
MTIPSNTSFSSSRQRLTVRCTCDNLDVITVTLKKKQVTNPRQPYRIAEDRHDGEFTRLPPATESDVQWYLLGLVEAGRIPMTKAKSMLHALQDDDLRSIGGNGALAATVTVSGHVDWVDGGPVIVTLA